MLPLENRNKAVGCDRIKVSEFSMNRGAEPGVIGNGPGKYRFWTVGYLYSYGTPPANSLPAAFLGYLNSYAAKDILRGQGYIPCADRGLTSVQAFCQP